MNTDIYLKEFDLWKELYRAVKRGDWERVQDLKVNVLWQLPADVQTHYEDLAKEAGIIY